MREDRTVSFKEYDDCDSCKLIYPKIEINPTEQYGYLCPRCTKKYESSKKAEFEAIIKESIDLIQELKGNRYGGDEKVQLIQELIDGTKMIKFEAQLSLLRLKYDEVEN